MNQTAVAGAPSRVAPVDDGRLLTVAEAADALGVGVRMVRRLVAERRLEFLRVGRHIRVRESAVRRFLEAATVPPAAPARWGAHRP